MKSKGGGGGKKRKLVHAMITKTTKQNPTTTKMVNKPKYKNKNEAGEQITEHQEAHQSPWKHTLLKHRK